jgi:hypothetical protein
MTSAKIIALEVPAPSSAMATACRQRVSQDRKGLFGKDTATRPGSAMQTVDPPAFASAPKRWRSAHTHLAYKRGVTGSNPVAPTMFPQLDAVLCADGPVRSLAGLSLVAEHQCGHGALYGAVKPCAD